MEDHPSWFTVSPRPAGLERIKEAFISGRPLPQVQGVSANGEMHSPAWVAHVGLHLRWSIPEIRDQPELFVFHERGFSFDSDTQPPSWNKTGVGVECRLLNWKPTFHLIPRGGLGATGGLGVEHKWLCGEPGCTNKVTATGPNQACCSALCFMRMQNLGEAEPAEEDAGPAATAPAPAPAGETAPAPAGASAGGT